MIYVDQLFGCRTPWGGGRLCHLISDSSVRELLEFAARISMPPSWFQTGSIPHFDLAPKYRARAVAAGAIEVDRQAFVAAMRRYRAANPAEFATPRPLQAAQRVPERGR